MRHAVLGDGEGSAEFFVEKDFVSSSLVRRSPDARALRVPRLDVNQEIGRFRPTVLVIDIEGAEYDLMPLILWDGIKKIVIDLHPGVIGVERTAAVLNVLRGAGFEVEKRLSSSRKKFLQRRQPVG